MSCAGAQEYELGDITAREFDDAEDEAHHIARTIRSLRGVEFNDRGELRGLTWSDVAVLVRIGRHPGGLMAAALAEAEIPAIVQGQVSLVGSDEGQAVQDLFHHIADCVVEITDFGFQEAPIRAQLAESWGNARFGLSPAALAEAIAYANRMRELLLDNPGSMPTVQEVYREFLRRAKLDEGQLPAETRDETMYNFGVISGAITAWESINYWTSPADKFNNFVQFLSTDARILFNEAAGSNPYATPDAVTICTVHRAKGCE